LATANAGTGTVMPENVPVPLALASASSVVSK
jgi:hypothetical protein